MNTFAWRAVSALLIATGVPAASQAAAVDPVARAMAGSALITIKALQAQITALQNGQGTPTVTLPTQTTASTVTGTPTVGNVLTASLGTYTGNPTFAIQWQRGGTNITGQTGNTYTTVSADTNLAVGYQLTATNSAGSATFQSSTVTVSAAAQSSSASLDFSSAANSQYAL